MASPDSQETGLSGDSVSAGTDSSTHPGSDELRTTAEAGTAAVAKVGTVSQPLNGQDLAAAEDRCNFFVQRKKRNCRMMVKPGKRFCGEHGLHEEAATTGLCFSF